jgi:hypothetical protein
MKQATVISLYGDKQCDLDRLITECQELVIRAVGTAFAPYDTRQIHATIVGLGSESETPRRNANFAKYRDREVPMDIDGFLAYLRGCGHIPFAVQLGGFADRHYPFTSRDARPYDRSFSIQGDKVVLMGWPLRGQPLEAEPVTPAAWAQEARIYPPTLDTIRHAAQAFGILHGYHRTMTDTDNDLFFRIGLIDSTLNAATQRTAEVHLREALSTRRPLVAEVGLGDLCIATYEDERLPLESTQAWSVTDRTAIGNLVQALTGLTSR